MAAMQIQKVFDVQQVYKVKEGVSPEAVKAALAKNGQNELVVQNDKGTFVLAGKKLDFAHDAFTVTGFKHDPYSGKELSNQPYRMLKLPETGSEVELGELKGKLVHQDFEGGANWGYVVGAIGGGFAGLVGGMLIAEKMGMDGGGTAAPFIPRDPIGALGGMGLGMTAAVAGGFGGSIGLGRLVGWAKTKLNADENVARIANVASPLPAGSWKASSGPTILEKMAAGR